MKNPLSLWKNLQLHNKILLGLILGILAGAILGERILIIKPLGAIFLRLISMVIVPLIFASIVVGVAGLQDIKKVGRIGMRALIYFMTTTLIAVTIGLGLANVIKPGRGIDPQSLERVASGLGEFHESEGDHDGEGGKRSSESILETLVDTVPQNPLASMADGKMLQIIFFAVFFGIALTRIDADKARGALSLLEAVNDAMVWSIEAIMRVAPLGVFALVASIVGAFGVSILLPLLKYFMVVIVGLCIHGLIVYPLILRLFTSRRPVEFLKDIRPAQLLAFSTSSSSATLPVTMDCCIRRLRLPQGIASFICPLGATINMDGTALYLGVVAVFISQIFGMDLSVVDQLKIVATAVLTSVGAAGVPGSAIFMMSMVLTSVGIPLEGIALILGVDRILDMARTSVNVTGDCTAAAVVSALEAKGQQKS